MQAPDKGAKYMFLITQICFVHVFVDEFLSRAGVRSNSPNLTLKYRLYIPAADTRVYLK